MTNLENVPVSIKNHAMNTAIDFVRENFQGLYNVSRPTKPLSVQDMERVFESMSGDLAEPQDPLYFDKVATVRIEESDVYLVALRIPDRTGKPGNLVLTLRFRHNARLRYWNMEFLNAEKTHLA